MTPITNLDRIGNQAVEPPRRPPRLVVVETPQRAPRRSATEMWLLAFALVGAMTFAGAMVKFVLSPAIATVSGISTAASSFDGP